MFIKTEIWNKKYHPIGFVPYPEQVMVRNEMTSITRGYLWTEWDSYTQMARRIATDFELDLDHLLADLLEAMRNIHLQPQQ
jgi:hypothetical protein